MVQFVSLNPDGRYTCDRRVSRVDVALGSVLAGTEFPNEKISGGGSKDFDDVAGLKLYSHEGAQVSITYSDEG